MIEQVKLIEKEQIEKLLDNSSKIERLKVQLTREKEEHLDRQRHARQDRLRLEGRIKEMEDEYKNREDSLIE